MEKFASTIALVTEVEARRNFMKDYYRILGIAPDALPDQIKAAYRVLAKKYHPDHNPNNIAESEQKFKEMKEAYDILSDPQKRRAYHQSLQQSSITPPNTFASQVTEDMIASVMRNHAQSQNPNISPSTPIYSSPNTSSHSSSQPHSSSPFYSSPNLNHSDSASHQSHFTDNHFRRQQRGDDIHLELDVPMLLTLEGGKMLFAITKEIACPSCTGTGLGRHGKRQWCNYCQGRGEIFDSPHHKANNCSHCQGDGFMIDIPCPSCQGEGIIQHPCKWNLSIPAGIESGQMIKLANEGQPGRRGAPSGDLYIIVKISQNLNLKKDGLNIITEHTLNLKQALFGTILHIKTLRGEVDLSIPSGTQHGTKFKISQHGLKHNSQIGDHIVQISLHIPEHLTFQQQKLFEEFWGGGIV